jgi:hypothetical protein
VRAFHHLNSWIRERAAIMAKENVKIPESPVVARLVAAGVSTARTFRGYVGTSRTEGYVTLYPSLGNLSASVEIARADILDCLELPEPGQPVILWVRTEAQVTLHQVVTAESASSGRLQIQVGPGLAERGVENCHSNCSSDNCHSNCRIAREAVENCHSNCSSGNCHSNCRLE